MAQVPALAARTAKFVHVCVELKLAAAAAVARRNASLPRGWEVRAAS